MADEDKKAKQEEEAELEEQTIRVPPQSESDPETVKPGTNEASSDDDNEDTFVRDPDETRMGDMPDMDMLTLGAKLVVASKQDQGREHYIANKEIFLGRGQDCDVQLSYPGVSRRHFKLSYNDNQMTIEDLGSKFGTIVAGQKIEGTATLSSGQSIQVGELLLHYYEGGASTPMTPGLDISKIMGNMNPLQMKIAGGVAGFIFLLLLIAVFKPSDEPVTIVQAPTPVAPVDTQDSRVTERAESDLKEARKLAEEGQIDQALIIIRGVMEVDPGNVEAQSLEKRWHTQASLATLIFDAQTKVEAGRLDDARELVFKIFEIAPDNQEGKKVLAEIERLRETKKDLAKLDEARGLLKEGRIDAAQNILQSITDPTLTGEVEKITAQCEDVKKAEVQHQNAMEQWNAGKLPEALAQVREGLRYFGEHQGLKQLEIRIENLMKLRKEADQLLQGADPLGARSVLNKILDITGKNHPLGIQAAADLGQLDAGGVLLGQKRYQEALQYYLEGQLREAYAIILELNQQYPGEAHYLELQNEIKLKMDNLAVAMFRAGYIIEESEPLRAKEIWRRLLQFLPEDHPYFRKARGKIRN